MKITVKVKAGAKVEKIEKIGDKHFEAWIKDPPREGKANKRLLKNLAESLRTSSKNLKIISGEKSKRKIIEVE